MANAPTALGGQPSTPAVPIGAPEQPTQSIGAENFLKQITEQQAIQDQQIQQTMKQAMIPGAAYGPGTSPGLAVSPVSPYTPAKFQEHQVVGAHNQQMQNIGAVLTGAANAVGQITTAIEQRKQRVLAVDLQRVMQATQGVQEAKDALAANPKSAQAQLALKHNMNILNVMLSDDKKRKQYAKALDISFTDPSKNQTMEHGAAMQAVHGMQEQQAMNQQSQQAQNQPPNYTQQYLNQIPEVIRQNPELMQKLQVEMGSAAANSQLLGKAIPAAIRSAGEEAVSRYTQSQETLRQQQHDSAEAASRLQTTQMHDKALITAANARAGAVTKAEQLRAATALKVAGIKANTEQQKIAHTYMSHFHSIMGGNMAPAQKYAQMNQLYGHMTANLKNMPNKIAQDTELRNQIQTAFDKGNASQEELNSANAQIREDTHMQTYLTEHTQQMLPILNQLATAQTENPNAAGQSATSQSSTTSTTRSSASGSRNVQSPVAPKAAAPTYDTNPDSYNSGPNPY